MHRAPGVHGVETARRLFSESACCQTANAVASWEASPVSRRTIRRMRSPPSQKSSTSASTPFSSSTCADRGAADALRETLCVEGHLGPWQCSQSHTSRRRRLARRGACVGPASIRAAQHALQPPRPQLLRQAALTTSRSASTLGWSNRSRHARSLAAFSRSTSAPWSAANFLTATLWPCAGAVQAQSRHAELPRLLLELLLRSDTRSAVCGREAVREAEARLLISGEENRSKTTLPNLLHELVRP